LISIDGLITPESIILNLNHLSEREISEEEYLANNDAENTGTGNVQGRAEKVDYDKLSKQELISFIIERDSQLSELLSDLEVQMDRFNTLKNQHIRLEADFVNFRKRSVKDRQNLIANTKEEVILNLLNVKMNIDRAFVQIENAKNMEGLRKGLEMVEMQLRQFLESQGVKEITGEGECFDPNFQEAVNTVIDEKAEEETVLKMVEKGYMLNNRVVIPMKCIVSIPPENVVEEQ